ncbi:DNA polymerase III subunit alpha [Candidatus Saccharibacteria bacterium RIFCSPLOWO2_01_FULL_48_13]|nr:MAG: DNA polymerase III subunit alpha [Candidatus Saccharibacteria bacterium RIFCSPLOWO2_01_FULL_48_13]
MGSAKTLEASDFVHLHNHTHYSLLDGLTKVKQLVERIKSCGMEAVAITDHGTMSGVIELYKAAQLEGVKPILGMEAYVASRSHLDKDPARDRQIYHLTLLAENDQGYQNLMKLATVASLEGFYYKPRIDRQLLEKYNQGVIVLSGCMGGEISDALAQGDLDQAVQTAKWYKKVFRGRYYIEIADHGHPQHPTRWEQQTKVNDQLLKIAKQLQLPAVVTCDAHYLKADDQVAHEVLLCVQTGAYLDDKDRMTLAEFDLHVADPIDIIGRWGKDHPELIKNSRKIANRCSVQIKMGDILIPKFPTPARETERSLLNKLVWQGLAWRYRGLDRAKAANLSPQSAKKYLNPEVISRANYELSVVDKMGFNGYFLIVADFTGWGKDQGIVFGPGRGSAASSIMAYALRITEIDPLKYDLLFERFLNPDRISMPDMDIDIQDNRRDEVIAYCVGKYGHEQVANIVTFGRMAARNSVRDVARGLQVPYAEADRLAKMIPPPVQGRHTSLAKHLAEVPDLAAEYKSSKRSAEVFDLAQRLEGTIRSHGVHAAGVVIAPDKIVKFVPLEMAQKGVVATQYSMGPIEDLGLLKIDFLGLSNLTTIKNALRIIKKVYKKDIDISAIPLDDKKTYTLLQKGETTGIFQLESAGMKRYLKQLKPTVFEDIIAMVALYRPGPMQWIDDFIARKQGQKQIEYLHPVMKEALENTYGVIVYQEQVMQISKDMCGFSGGQADTLRKAIGKKEPEVLAKLKTDFIEGAIKKVGAKKPMMEKFWRQLEEFAAYCFNKVHSACYGLIAYQTAYLKAHYPDAFMASLMTSDYDNTDRLAIEINECNNMGIEVLRPDINESFHEFAVVPSKQKIRFGLDAIKNVGFGAAEELLRAREESGGKISSIDDYCRLVSPHVVNRKSLESLIKAGALDNLGDRDELMGNIEAILALSNRLQKDAASGQVDLFSGGDSPSSQMKPKLQIDKNVAKHSPFERLSWERELLGLYLSHHPLEDYTDQLEGQTTPIIELSEKMVGTTVVVGGSVSVVREIVTKKGSKMAFVKLADKTGEVELVVFPKKYNDQNYWVRDRVMMVQGSLSSGRDSSAAGELKILVDEVSILDGRGGAKKQLNLPPLKSSAPPPMAKTSQKNQRLYIRIADSSDQPLLLTLKSKLDNHQGITEVVLVTGEESNKQVIKLPQTIDVNETSIRELAEVFGSTNVVVR